MNLSIEIINNISLVLNVPEIMAKSMYIMNIHPALEQHRCGLHLVAQKVHKAIVFLAEDKMELLVMEFCVASYNESLSVVKICNHS
jgi:hypothetical protein